MVTRRSFRGVFLNRVDILSTTEFGNEKIRHMDENILIDMNDKSKNIHLRNNSEVMDMVILTLH